jgi:secreted trypsin-like serine protease
MKNLFFFFVMLFTFSPKARALYGYRPLAEGEYSSVVTLHLSERDFANYEYFCSGVAISPKKILTTGHCIDRMGDKVYGDNKRLLLTPEVVVVKSSKDAKRALGISFSVSYFEYPGYEGQDLALIELAQPLEGVVPAKIALRSQIMAGSPLTLVARGLKAQTLVKGQKQFGATTMVFGKGDNGGACRGDSGGGVFVEVNGQQMLAGILIYDGDGNCERKEVVSVYPRGQF